MLRRLEAAVMFKSPRNCSSCFMESMISLRLRMRAGGDQDREVRRGLILERVFGGTRSGGVALCGMNIPTVDKIGLVCRYIMCDISTMPYLYHG